MLMVLDTFTMQQNKNEREAIRGKTSSFLLLPKSVILLNVIGFLIFFSQGVFNMTMIVMLNNTIEYDEVRFHERHDSVISAVRSFATKLASAVD